jgi:hypothetical protein
VRPKRFLVIAMRYSKLEATNALVLLAVSEHELEVRPFAMEMTKVLVAIVGWLHGMRS